MKKFCAFEEEDGVIGEITLEKSEADGIRAIEEDIEKNHSFGLYPIDGSPLEWGGDSMSKGISDCVHSESLYPIIKKAVELWQKAVDEGYMKTDERKSHYIDLLDEDGKTVSSILICFQMNQYGFTICFLYER